MPRGRRPEPAEIKKAKGNPGKRPIPEVPAAPAHPADPPEWLTADRAIAIWHLLFGDLQRMKLLKATDQIAFARYCQVFDTYLESCEKLAEEGAVYETSSAHVDKIKRTNPWFGIRARYQKELVDLEDRLGMNPASRQRIMVQMAAATQAPLLPGMQPGKNEESDAPPTAKESPVGILGGRVLN